MKNLKKLYLIIAALLILGLVGCGNSKEDWETEKLEDSWNDSSTLGAKLPLPESKYGAAVWETSAMFVAKIADTPEDDYKMYVEECKKKGFDIEAKEKDKSYYAKNEEGEDLSIKFNEKKKTMEIVLTLPKE